jgi:hypothetical protein
MMPNSEPKEPAPFQLPQSGLTLTGSRLTRRTGKGEVVAEFDLSEMNAIEVRVRREAPLLMVGAGFVGIAVAVVQFVGSLIWVWILAIFFGCLAGACWLGSNQRFLAFTVGKSGVELLFTDPDGDAHAFALMLQQTKSRLRR